MTMATHDNVRKGWTSQLSTGHYTGALLHEASGSYIQSSYVLLLRALFPLSGAWLTGTWWISTNL